MATDFIPFKSIGLCFSGGGYRATFFSLGVLAYLDRIKYQDNSLLENVEAISSVSGGTILGVAYSKAAQENEFSFIDFYKKFYTHFEPKNDILLKTAVAKLEDDSVWATHSYKKRSLINAFALTYADMDLFSEGFQKFKKPNSKHLKHVCFNSTEFSFGLAFRFQNTGMFGNKPLESKEFKELKNKIQLGDVVASSSCFPLGFEPLVFPDDYFKDKNSPEYISLKSLDCFIDGVGIMDGGIADNQGIGSMINISKLAERERELDLIIVNDVSSFKMVPWEQDTTDVQESSSIKSSISNILSYFSLKPIYWITLLIGILILVLNSLEIIKGKSWASLYIIGGIISGFGILLTVFGSITSTIKKIGLSWISSLFKKNVPTVLVDEILTFKKLSVSLMKRMLTERVTSTVLMVNDIFLKQIRRLNYKLLYASTSLRHKVITSTVYELNGETTAYSKSFNYNKNIKPAPSKLLTSVGLTASEAPTSLWWDKKDIAKNRMDSLIACGEFTTCYKLIDYILKLKNSSLEFDIEDKEALDNLYKLLLKDWKEFNKNPLFQVEILKN